MGASQKQKRISLANGAVKDFEPSLVPKFTLACSVQGSLGSIVSPLPSVALRGSVERENAWALGSVKGHLLPLESKLAAL